MSQEPSPAWPEMMAKAASVQEIVAIANDFLDRLEVWELRELPPACRPRRLQTAVDISSYAYDLKHYASTLSGAASHVVGVLANMMADAALRITHLTGPHSSAHLTLGWSSEHMQATQDERR
jgi:hypothetical protein